MKREISHGEVATVKGAEVARSFFDFQASVRHCRMGGGPSTPPDNVWKNITSRSVSPPSRFPTS